MLLVSKVQRSSKGIFSTFHVLTFAIDTPVIEFLKCLFMMQNTQYILIQNTTSKSCGHIHIYH